jgi:hypothetical protein
MAVVKQGGSNPYAGSVNTTMGMRSRRPPECALCRERKDAELYTVNANGQVVCSKCSGSLGRGVLTPDDDSRYDVAPAESTPSE